MSDRLLNDEEPSLEEALQLKEALKIRDEILEKLDDVYGIIVDGPDMSDNRVELLAALPEDDLVEIASQAEEYSQNLRDFARLAHKALREQESE